MRHEEKLLFISSCLISFSLVLSDNAEMLQRVGNAIVVDG